MLCMAPTEYRVIAKRAEPRPTPTLRGLVAAGEALNPEVLRAWHEATGLWVRDGYGQTETGQITGMPLGRDAVPGLDGPPAARASTRGSTTASSSLDPATVPTFFRGYLGDDAPSGPWRTGDRVTQDDDGFLFFEGRNDDVIISAGYRIGPFEVESALVEHPAVAEAAVVAAPDDERGAVVRAVVVLRDGHAPSDALARELQDHVKAQTAPYKYPRIVEFAGRAAQDGERQGPPRRAAAALARAHPRLVLRAVDDDVRAADPARARGEQEGRDVGDLLRRAQPPERELALHPRRRRPRARRRGAAPSRRPRRGSSPGSAR